MNKLARPTKRQRGVKDVSPSNSNPKLPKHSHTRHVFDTKEGGIADWLSDIPSFRRRKPPIIVCAKSTPPSPGSNRRSTERTAASVTDINYRDLMELRNIYIESEDPPQKLIERAREIISRPRNSPEMSEDAFNQLVTTQKKIRNHGEGELVNHIVRSVMPFFAEPTNSDLERNLSQVWYNCVPLPVACSKQLPLTKQVPGPKQLALPRPKPDLTFGYSKPAFNDEQLVAIDLLVHDELGTSYAVPDSCLHFPFLTVEFKSQATNGTLYVATNQVAGAGAIAMQGYLELMSRSFGSDSLDFNEPSFFSMTMDHKVANVNIHWIRKLADGQYSFHVDELSAHFMNNIDHVRGLVRAIKNILDEYSDVRLNKLHAALDEYMRKVLTPAPERQRRGKRSPRKQARGVLVASKTESVIQEMEEEETTDPAATHPNHKRPHEADGCRRVMNVS